MSQSPSTRQVVHDAKLTDQIVGRLFAPTPLASLVYFRVLFGAIMLWEVFRYFQHGWIKRYYVDPMFFSSCFGLPAVEPWPGNLMYAHFVVLGILAVYICMGLWG